MAGGIQDPGGIQDLPNLDELEGQVNNITRGIGDVSAENLVKSLTSAAELITKFAKQTESVGIKEKEIYEHIRKIVELEERLINSGKINNELLRQTVDLDRIKSSLSEKELTNKKSLEKNTETIKKNILDLKNIEVLRDTNTMKALQAQFQAEQRFLKEKRSEIDLTKKGSDGELRALDAKLSIMKDLETAAKAAQAIGETGATTTEQAKLLGYMQQKGAAFGSLKDTATKQEADQAMGASKLKAAMADLAKDIGKSLAKAFSIASIGGMILESIKVQFKEGEAMKQIGATLANQFSTGFSERMGKQEFEDTFGTIMTDFGKTTEQLKEDLISLTKAGALQGNTKAMMTTFYELKNAFQLTDTEASKLMTQFKFMGSSNSNLTKTLLVMKQAMKETGLSFDQFRTSVFNSWSGLRQYGIELDDVIKIQKSMGAGVKGREGIFGIQGTEDIEAMTKGLLNMTTQISEGGMALLGGRMGMGGSALDKIAAWKTGGLGMSLNSNGMVQFNGQTGGVSGVSKIEAIAGYLGDFMKNSSGTAGEKYVMGQKMLGGLGMGNLGEKEYRALIDVAGGGKMDQKLKEALEQSMLPTDAQALEQAKKMVTLEERMAALQETFFELVGSALDSIITLLGTLGVLMKDLLVVEYGPIAERGKMIASLLSNDPKKNDIFKIGEVLKASFVQTGKSAVKFGESVAKLGGEVGETGSSGFVGTTTFVKVFIGDKELKDHVKHEVENSSKNSEVK